MPLRGGDVAASAAVGLAIVEAESGGGKTRLLDELARRIVRVHGWVLRGQGPDQGAQKPLRMLAGVVTEIRGTGIPPAIRARIFDPFFTKKRRRTSAEIRQRFFLRLLNPVQ